MDWLTFISSLLRSLAWPIAVVVIALVFRRPLSGLLPLLQHLKYKDLELDFGRGVQEVQEDLEQTLTQEEIVTPDQPVAERLADVSPRAAVMEAWREVEASATDTVRALSGGEVHMKWLTLKKLRQLEESKLLDTKTVALLSDFRGLRNQAAHAPDFALSKESAMEYVRTASMLASHLRNLSRRPR
jgi:hypothetical protein